LMYAVTRYWQQHSAAEFQLYFCLYSLPFRTDNTQKLITTAVIPTAYVRIIHKYKNHMHKIYKQHKFICT